MGEMRKIFAIILAAALLFAGCNRSDDEKVPITLAAGAASVSTRVVDDIVQDALFEDGEQIDVFVTDLMGEITYAQPQVYTTNGTTAVGSVTGNVMETNPVQFYPRGSVSIKAYYPQGFAGTTTTGTETFTVAADQSDFLGYKASDLMAATVPSQSPASHAVNLPFSHKLSRVVVYLETMTGFTLSDVVSIKVLAKRKADFDKETFATSLTASGNDIEEITIAGAGGRIGACIVPPQTLEVTSGTTNFLVKIELTGGSHQYVYYRNTAPLQMIEGNTYLLRLNCSSAVITGYTTVVDSWASVSSDKELLGELLKLIEGSATITPFTDGSGTSGAVYWGEELDS